VPPGKKPPRTGAARPPACGRAPGRYCRSLLQWRRRCLGARARPAPAPRRFSRSTAKPACWQRQARRRTRGGLARSSSPCSLATHQGPGAQRRPAGHAGAAAFASPLRIATVGDPSIDRGNWGAGRYRAGSEDPPPQGARAEGWTSRRFRHGRRASCCKPLRQLDLARAFRAAGHLDDPADGGGCSRASRQTGHQAGGMLCFSCWSGR